VPQNLRTDLKGASIKAILSEEGPSAPWDDAAAAKFSAATGINVQVIRGDRSATDRLATYRQQLSSGSGDADVYQIDVIWPGILAEFAEDLKPGLGDTTGFFPAIIQNNTVGGKLVAVPWFTDAGLLYYRTDLLQKYGYTKPPATWAELEEMAKKIQAGERASNPDFWGFVWQGKAYEGLTCAALEWQVSNGGGSIIEPDGTVSVNNAQTVAAFERAKGWVSTISPPGVTTYQEEEARGVWQAGNAAFMRNWPYAFALGQAPDSAIKGKFDVTLMPKGDGEKARNADTLGGWQLMVNKNSQNKEAAVEFVKFLTSPEVQKARALELSNLPTRPALYDDPDVLKLNPYYKPLKDVFSGGAVARPSTVSADLYNDVSTAYFTAVNQVLTGQQDAKTAVANLETEIKKLLK
jgi:trehalose/maltose transport system substrate-binding protein